MKLSNKIIIERFFQTYVSSAIFIFQTSKGTRKIQPSRIFPFPPILLSFFLAEWFSIKGGFTPNSAREKTLSSILRVPQEIKLFWLLIMMIDIEDIDGKRKEDED